MKCYIVLSLIFCSCILVASKKDLLIEEYGTLGTKADFYEEEFLNGK